MQCVQSMIRVSYWMYIIFHGLSYWMKDYTNIQSTLKAIIKRREPAQRSLSTEHLSHNKDIASNRVIVENIFGRFVHLIPLDQSISRLLIIPVLL